MKTWIECCDLTGACIDISGNVKTTLYLAFRITRIRRWHHTHGEQDNQTWTRRQTCARLQQVYRHMILSDFNTRVFPNLAFIHDFGVHRNMYRALKAIYLIPAYLSDEERRKIANVFTLTLDPHAANMQADVEGRRATSC